MGLNLGEDEDKIFSQSDVRETATEGKLDASEPVVVAVAGSADMTGERVLTAGEGIDLTDGGANSTLIIAGEDATTANKGIASFNTDDFSVTGGAVSLKNKTSYWSCSGVNFHRNDVNALYTKSATDGYITMTTDSEIVVAPVFLPHGAVITGVIVYTDREDEGGTWELVRATIGGQSGAVKATAGSNVEDTSITDPIVDNENYAYFLTYTLPGSDNDRIEGARITYTTDYD